MKRPNRKETSRIIQRSQLLQPCRGPCHLLLLLHTGDRWWQKKRGDSTQTRQKPTSTPRKRRTNTNTNNLSEIKPKNHPKKPSEPSKITRKTHQNCHKTILSPHPSLSKPPQPTPPPTVHLGQVGQCGAQELHVLLKEGLLTESPVWAKPKKKGFRSLLFKEDFTKPTKP